MAFDLSSYVDVQERIVRFWKEYPDGRIVTQLISLPDEFEQVVFRADVFKHRDNPAPDVTGWDAETKGSGGANNTSWHANCETSAIGRALANMGYAKTRDDRPSQQEMNKAARGEHTAPAPPPRAAAAPTNGAALTPATPKQRNYIKGLIKEAGWVTEGEDGKPHTDEMRLDRFLLKHYGATLSELGQEAAQRLIDDLLDGKKKREAATEAAHLTATANRTAAALAGMPAPVAEAGNDQYTA